MTIIGLIPAGGRATRMYGLPKYHLPTPDGTLIDVLRRRMVKAGITDVHVAVNGIMGIALENAYYPESPTVCGALLAAYTGIAPSQFLPTSAIRDVRVPKLVGDDDTVVFAMPDTYWTDDLAIEKLIITLNKGADVAVGVWKIRPDQRGKLGMCVIKQDRLMSVIDKDPDSPLEWAWGAIAWRPEFWNCIRPEDTHLGMALNRPLTHGAIVKAVKMAGDYWDCGTPAEYFKLCSTWAQEAVAHGS